MMIRLIAPLFFLSGLTGLVLETIWFRELSLVFGSSSWASGTVTGAFLGGLGLGGLVAAKLVDRVRRPVLLYAALEGFVGLYALLSPLVLAELDVLQYRVLGGAMLSASAYAAIRFVAIFLALLPPTMAMGATLPLLVRGLTQRYEQIGPRIGALYGINTLGAFAGVLTGGFLLLPYLGQQKSIWAVAALSLTVAAAAFLFSLLLDKKQTALPEPTGMDLTKLGKPLQPYAMLGAFMFLSGFSAMLVQVAYTRVLAVVLGSSIYSFTLTVAVFLAGIGLGSLLYASILAGRVKPFRTLAIAQGILALFLVLGVQFADRLPELLMAYAKSGQVATPQIFFVHGGLIAAVLLLPTLAMGISFPAALRLISAGVRRLGYDVGVAYFLNTLGSILGSFLAAFVLIPMIGLQATILNAAGVAILWTALFASTEGGFLSKKKILRNAPVAVVLAVALFLLPGWDLGRLTSGMFRVGLAQKMAQQDRPVRSRMLYYKDGPVGTVTVEQRADIRTMRVNGKAEASNRFDMPTQVLVGLLPMLLHDREEGHKAALIGYGSGVTAGAMLQTPLRSLTAVELEPRVVDASLYFEGVNFHPTDDERMNLVIGDARTVLGYSANKFDVIVSEPSNPWVAGAGSLFTVDFYRRMERRLAEGGIYAQWLQLYELSPENLKILMRGFHKVFPNILVFSASERGVDLILLGKKTPWRLKVNQLIERAKRAGTQDALSVAHQGGAYDLLSLLAVNDLEVQRFVGSGIYNTDDNGYIEFAGPKDMLQYERYAKNALEFHFDSEHGELLPLLDDLGDTKETRASRLGELALHLLAHGRTDAAYQVAGASMQIHINELAVEVEEVCELIYLKDHQWVPVTNGWLITEKEDEQYTMLAMSIVAGEPAEARRQVDELMSKDKDPRLKLVAGALAVKQLDFERAERLLVPLAEDEAFRKRFPEVDFYAGRALDRQLKFQQAVRYMARFNIWRKKEELPIDFSKVMDEVEPMQMEIELDEEP